MSEVMTPRTHNVAAIYITTLMELASASLPCRLADTTPVNPAASRRMYNSMLARDTPMEFPQFLTVASTLEAVLLFCGGRADMISVLLGLVNRPVPKPNKPRHISNNTGLDKFTT